jgi:hypothetical protein
MEPPKPSADDSSSDSDSDDSSVKAQDPPVAEEEGFVEEPPPKRKGQSIETKAKAKAKAAACKAKAKEQSKLLKDSLADNKMLLSEKNKLEAKFKTWKKNHKTHQLSTSFNAAGGFKQNKKEVEKYLALFATTVLTKNAKDMGTPICKCPRS